MMTHIKRRLCGTTSEAIYRGSAGSASLVPITFTVEGAPRPKARARRGAGGRWYTPQATRDYEEAVGIAARGSGAREPLKGAVRLSIDLWLPDRRRRDVDNCAKSICDALNGIAYQDDSQIVELIVRRHVDRERPRAEVIIECAETSPREDQ
jgi:Holliday junction resolvase RusA-like endonuclease